MALEFSTIGVKVLCKTETSAGTRPTSGYTEIPDIKQVPAIAMNVNQIDVSNLVDEYKRYIPGQKDVGQDFTLTGNLTTALKNAWASVVAAAASGWSSGKLTWFEIKVPDFASFYLAGVPTEMGLSDMAVDSVIETTLHITPNKIHGWDNSST